MKTLTIPATAIHTSNSFNLCHLFVTPKAAGPSAGAFFRILTVKLWRPN